MFLENYQSTDNLYQLQVTHLESFCQELRNYIIEEILKQGGHFAANLGVIELTVALIRNFPPEKHPHIWDVGHQSYAFKILTDRKEQIKQIRSFTGISGFPKIEESPYDFFGTGHSSTAISAAMGMAFAQLEKAPNLSHTVIAIVGDGALTGGMSFEALNNLKGSKLNILIVYNDNGMGIDPNAGALHQAEAQDIKQFFEFFGLHYHGPIDGHDIQLLNQELSSLKKIDGPRLLHVKTTKGKGYPAAELEQTKWHSAPKFVKVDPHKKQERTWQQAFTSGMQHLAATYDNVMGITPAMPSSSGLVSLMNEYPQRFIDVTIAEQHALTFAAGLARAGKKPYVAIYSTFLQRAYDQFIHDIALQKLAVVVCIDRAGLVGEDGPTHHGVFDLAFLLPIPGIQIWSPATEKELHHALNQAYHQNMPVCIRYPKGPVPQFPTQEMLPFSWMSTNPKAQILVVSTGKTTEMVHEILESLQELEIDSLHIQQIKPLPNIEFNKQYDHVITLEDGVVLGGMGNYLRMMWTELTSSKWIHMGVNDVFIPHGNNAELYPYAGYSAQDLLQSIHKLIAL